MIHRLEIISLKVSESCIMTTHGAFYIMHNIPFDLYADFVTYSRRNYPFNLKQAALIVDCHGAQAVAA